MRNIIQQAGLSFHESLDPLRHGVEISHQAGNLITPPEVGGAGPRTEISSSQLASGSTQANHRHGQEPREEIADESRRDDSDDQARDGEAAWAQKEARPGGRRQ